MAARLRNHPPSIWMLLLLVHKHWYRTTCLPVNLHYYRRQYCRRSYIGWNLWELVPCSAAYEAAWLQLEVQFNWSCLKQALGVPCSELWMLVLVTVGCSGPVSARSIYPVIYFSPSSSCTSTMTRWQRLRVGQGQTRSLGHGLSLYSHAWYVFPLFENAFNYSILDT